MADCPICAATAGTTREFSSEVLRDPRAVASNAAAIADSLGFCTPHMTLLMRMPSQGILDEIAAAATGHVAELLGERPGMEDKRRALFFTVAQACPACAHVERHASAALNREALRWRTEQHDAFLCLRHFRALIGVSQLPDLVPWTARQVRALTSRVADLEAIASERAHAAATLIAGGISDVCSGPLPAADDACPACDAMRQAHDHWLCLATESARAGADSPAVLPSCAQHIWECAHSPEPKLAEAAMRFALTRAVDDLQRAIVQLRDEEERARIERESVWYRRKSPAYLLGRRRKHINSVTRCPACEWMSLAAARAIEDMLSRLEDRRARKAVEAGPTLCMKHFAEAYIVAPGGAVLDALMAMQTRRLHDLSESVPSWHAVISFLSEPHQPFSVLQ